MAQTKIAQTQKAQRAEIERSLGRDMADDLKFRFHARVDQIKAAAWLLSFTSIPAEREAAFLEAAGIKWARTQFGSETLVPLAWPDRVISDGGEYFAFENGGRGARLELEAQQ